MKSQIEQQVMGGIAAVYLLRRLTSRVALESYALFILSFSLTLFVSLQHVGRNFITALRGGEGSTAHYVTAAVLNTNLVVQAILVLGGIAAILFVRDAVRASIRPTFA